MASFGREVFKGDLVVFEWRDSYADHGQNILGEHPFDTTWISVGWVVRVTPLFLTVANGVQQAGAKDEQLDNILSVPWTQIIELDILE